MVPVVLCFLLPFLKQSLSRDKSHRSRHRDTVTEFRSIVDMLRSLLSRFLLLSLLFRAGSAADGVSSATCLDSGQVPSGTTCTCPLEIDGTTLIWSDFKAKCCADICHLNVSRLICKRLNTCSFAVTVSLLHICAWSYWMAFIYGLFTEKTARLRR